MLGWWKLGKEDNATTSQGRQGLASKVYGPKRAKKYSDVSAAIETWEMDVQQLQQEGCTRHCCLV